MPAFDLHLGAAVFVGQHFHLGGGHQGAFVGLGGGIEEQRGGGDGVTGGDVGRGLGRSLRQLAGTGGSQAAHVRHDVGDTAVAVDTGLTLLDGDRVLGTGIGALGQNVHRLVAVAAAAGGGVVGFQLVPDGLGHPQLVGFILFRGIQGADRLVIDILHGADLGPQVGGGVARDVAVGALGADPLGVLEVDAALILGQRGLHGVAGDAEFGGAGLVQHGHGDTQCRDTQQGPEQQEPEPGFSYQFSNHGGVFLRSIITYIVLVQ